MATVALGGCDESPRSNQCARICEKRELCDSSTDENDCLEDCVSRDYLSNAYVSYWAQCVAPSSVSCDFAMDDDAVDDCVTDELRSDPTPEPVEDLCQALSTKLAACSQADPLATARQCERGDSLKLSDDYLDKSRECVDALCEDVEACFEDLADSYNTQLSVVPDVAAALTSEEKAEESASGDESTDDGSASGLDDQVAVDGLEGKDSLGGLDGGLPF